MREPILIGLELFLELSDNSGVFVEENLQIKKISFKFSGWRRRRRVLSTHSPVRLPEPDNPALHVLELVGRQLHFVDLQDSIPQFLVLFLQHNDQASGLGVEGAGDMLDGVGNELFDAGV